ALLEGGVFRIVGILRFFLGVQVIEVAEKLIEAMVGGQELVLVAQMVLAELTGDVALRLQQLGDGAVVRPQSLIRTWQADLRQASADGRLAGDKCRASGRATLLAIPVGEQSPFLGQPVDVRRAISHHAVVVRTQVEPPDVIAPNDQNVGLLPDLRFSHVTLLFQYGIPAATSSTTGAKRRPPFRGPTTVRTAVSTSKSRRGAGPSL